MWFGFEVFRVLAGDAKGMNIEVEVKITIGCPVGWDEASVRVH